ncbi:hypothetical protein H6F86_07290 [Phormidium sp. FACHB-592]|uniref:Uncharacterized protein n=1 Tax=Stenomitos frigidus AS-A4 TaxID=2933935 RepID=A0ABV0KGR2_9CYAN|nr:hypothetical protein [Phormidium sp. FACHB-592]MBD2073695.1 hypothetical protein [Phormidium sp. FACHB-592]
MENGSGLSQQSNLRWLETTVLKIPFLELSEVLTLLHSLRDRALTSH